LGQVENTPAPGASYIQFCQNVVKRGNGGANVLRAAGDKVLGYSFMHANPMRANFFDYSVPYPVWVSKHSEKSPSGGRVPRLLTNNFMPFEFEM
jgi:hypothetical protein